MTAISANTNNNIGAYNSYYSSANSASPQIGNKKVTHQKDDSSSFCKLACLVIFFIGAPVMIGCGVSFSIVALWAVGTVILCLAAAVACCACCCLCCAAGLVAVFGEDTVNDFNRLLR